MTNKLRFILLFLSAITSFGISIGSAFAATPGTWNASAEFGTFELVVNSGGTGIERINYSFSNWTCGTTTMSGGMGIIPGIPWPISSGEFSFTNYLDPGRNREMTISGSFESASQASGNWEAVINGTNCEGIWSVVSGFSVGGSVSGLSGSGLVLENNGGDDLAISADGSFTFGTRLEDGAGYSVTVKTQPTSLNQFCVVDSGNGAVSGADVTNVEVTCTLATSCNVNIVSEVVETSVASHEACEILAVGPSFIAEDGASVSLASGWEIWFLPGFTVEQGATLNANVCGQSLCMISVFPMPAGCHSCVDEICAIDSTCCTEDFDASCLDKVNSVCGLICE